MHLEGLRVENILARYENALTEYGLGYASRLRAPERAGVIVRRHEKQGKDYFDPIIFADYSREIDERFSGNGVSKNHYQMLLREVQRFMWFAKTG
jgi:hypothetical protein